MLLEDLAEFDFMLPAKPAKDKIIGFKGFNNLLQCQGKFQYEIGKTYTKPFKLNPATCSADGFHYCNNIIDVFTHFKNNGTNRFAIVEVSGGITDESDKSICTTIRVIKELTKEDVDKLTESHKEIKISNDLGLLTVKKLQSEYPLMQVTGSLGLFLHGIKLKRWSNKGANDIDIVMPFYHHIDDEKFDTEDTDEERSEACDFQQVLMVDNFKVDIRIDAKQRYEMIAYGGFKYRVSVLESIMEAKFRYALQGNQKHKSDVYEICGKVTKPKKYDE